VAKKRSKDHYLPAAVIGGFGERPAKKGRRKAKVAVWVDALGRVVSTTAEKIGWKYSLYDVPGVAGSAETFESVWQSYESDLPTAIEHLAQETPSTRDLGALVAHVAFAAARFANFTQSVVEWSQQQGKTITEAEARSERGDWLLGGLEVAKWRWRAVHAPDNSVFVLPDTGYAVIKPDASERPYWVFLPLGPRIGVLVKRPEDGEPLGPDSMDYRQLTWTAGEVVNDACLRQPNRTVLISHPSRVEELERLTTSSRQPQTLGGGPYVGRNSDWW
jgi:hypothetical protein